MIHRNTLTTARLTHSRPARTRAAWLACAALVLSSSVATAQEPEMGPPAPAAASDHPLATFFSELGQLEQGAREDHVRIAWWGDSAIVADGYTGQLRRQLQGRFGDGGPGFILPATTFNGYLHKQVRMKRANWEPKNVIKGELRNKRYGYGGIVSQSYGGASTTFMAESGSFGRVSVYHHAAPKAGTLQLFLNGAGKADMSHEARTDEPTEDVWTTDLPEGTTQVRVRAGGKGLTRVYGVALESKKPGVVVDTLGLLGMRARRWLRADAAHQKRVVAARAPTLLVLNYGGNERVDHDLSVDGHAKDLVALTNLFRAGAPSAACLIVGPIAHGQRRGGKVRLDPRLETVYAAQRKAAKEAGCGFVDTVALMGGDDAIANYRKQKLIGKDLAHLNREGHVELGNAMASWLLAEYDAYKAAL